MCVSAHSDQTCSSEELLTNEHRLAIAVTMLMIEPHRESGVLCSCRSASAPLVWRGAGPKTRAAKRGCAVLGDVSCPPTPEGAGVLLW